MSLSFVAGSARDVFPADLAGVVEAELRKRFPMPPPDEDAVYRSDAVDGRGWAVLQERIPELAPIDPYQAVFIPAPIDCVTEVALPNVADPLHVCSLDALMTALSAYAKRESLPVDDVELMQLAANYLESEEEDADLDVQLYVQLMQTSKQASVHQQPLWIVA